MTRLFARRRRSARRVRRCHAAVRVAGLLLNVVSGRVKVFLLMLIRGRRRLGFELVGLDLRRLVGGALAAGGDAGQHRNV